MEKNTDRNTENKARKEYAGAQVDAAVNDHTDAAEVKQDVSLLNNNPRNDDM
ncbi:MAG: hypothetical protein K2O00_06650 [Muribaculaceae bacterium]|nr:hypothetical protein [Muribaculaceae bacterium]